LTGRDSRDSGGWPATSHVIIITHHKRVDADFFQPPAFFYPMSKLISRIALGGFAVFSLILVVSNGGILDVCKASPLIH